MNTNFDEFIEDGYILCELNWAVQVLCWGVD
jgi:hypothetical protein